MKYVFVPVWILYMCISPANIKNIVRMLLFIAACLCFPLQISACTSLTLLQNQTSDTNSRTAVASGSVEDTFSSEMLSATTAGTLNPADVPAKQCSNPDSLKKSCPVWKWTIQPAFQHWYGKTFGTPFGIGTPSIVVGVTPGCRFLETRAHYTVSVNKLTMPDSSMSNVGFANLDLLIIKEFFDRKLSAVLGLGWVGGFIHTNQGLGGAFGPVTVARLMYHFSPRCAAGLFIDSRTQMYKLPGSDVPIMSFSSRGITFGHADAQVQSGIALSFSRQNNVNQKK